ncbi:MAG: hypothetical protein ACI835_000046 [Planctomycetota bacterium]|jgi:hypothetical protein
MNPKVADANGKRAWHKHLCPFNQLDPSRPDPQRLRSE